jgi:hypothetical protein
MIGMLAAGLAVTGAFTAPSYCRLISSARSVQRYLRDLDAADSSMGPIERLVFSLVLANSRASQPQPPATARARM